MNRLKEIRLEKGIKQSEVALYLNVRQPTYSRYETGVNKLDPETLIKLSEFFDLSIDYIIGNSNVPMTLNQVRFDKEVDQLSDKEVFDKYELYLHGEKLTKSEAKKMLKMIRALNEDD